MNRKLFAAIAKQCDIRPMNPIIADGFVKTQVKHLDEMGTDTVMKEIDYAWKSAMSHVDGGLEYCGLLRCTPEETLSAMTPKRGTCDISRSSVYMVRAVFKYNGAYMDPIYLLLPFVDGHGTMLVKDVKYYIAPVLADPGISVSKSSLFIPVLQTNFTFRREMHQCVVDGAPSRSTAVTWSPVHQLFKTKKSAKRIVTSVPHYLFCKYGVTETFRRYAKCDVVVGEGKHDQYPTEEWVIITSKGIPPGAFSRRAYTPTNVFVAIPRQQYNLEAEILALGFFYVADHFTDRVQAKYIDNLNMWMVIMGLIIYTDEKHEGLLLEKMREHMYSNDNCLDTLSLHVIRRDGIDCNDLYDLMFSVTMKFGTLMHSVDAGSMFGKQLIVLRYLLSDFISDIFNLRFKLDSLNRKTLSYSEIKTHMSKSLKPDRLLKKRMRHGEFQVVSTASDCRIFGITNYLVQQSESVIRPSHHKKSSLSDPSTHVHGSVAVVGSPTNLPKSNPTGRSRANLYAPWDEHGILNVSEEDRRMANEIQAKLINTLLPK